MYPSIQLSIFLPIYLSMSIYLYLSICFYLGRTRELPDLGLQTTSAAKRWYLTSYDFNSYATSFTSYDVVLY